jgi:hypothetical protein
MSEQILERRATGLPGDPGLNVPDEPSAQRGANNRTFVIVGGAVIAGLVLGGAVLFVMKPGSAEEPLGPVPKGNPAAAAQAAPAEEGPEAAPAAQQVPARTTRLTSRDPFAPLVAKRPPAPVPAAVPTTASAPGTTASAPGTTASAPGTTASAPSAPAAPAPTPANGGTISALSISPLGDSVTLKLDGKEYEVAEGEQFATSYRLYNIFNEDCAGFLYGDQNAVVCEGDSVAIG